MIKGQDELLNTINTFTINNLPHSILLIGEYGSGHEEVCRYIAEKFGMQIYDLSDSMYINDECIDEIYQSSTLSLYYINVSSIGPREQNIILKLFEEPSPYTYIVLNCDSDDSVLDTIKSRSYILKFRLYTKEELRSLIRGDEELILKICTTPGQIEVANHTDMTGLYKLCNTIVTSVSKANFQNTLSISNMVNFKDEYDKYDLFLFIKTFKYVILESGAPLYMYELLNEMSKYIWNMNNKQQYFEHFLIELWKKSRD